MSEVLYRKSASWRKERNIGEILGWRPPRVIRDFYPGGFLCYDQDSSPVWLIPFGSADVRGNDSMTRTDKKHPLKTAKIPIHPLLS